MVHQQLNEPLPDHSRRTQNPNSILTTHCNSNRDNALNLGPQASRLQRFESGAAASAGETPGSRSKADQLKASSYPLHALAQRVVIRTERHSQKSFALAATRNARNGDHARL